MEYAEIKVKLTEPVCPYCGSQAVEGECRCGRILVEVSALPAVSPVAVSYPFYSGRMIPYYCEGFDRYWVFRLKEVPDRVNINLLGRNTGEKVTQEDFIRFLSYGYDYIVSHFSGIKLKSSSLRHFVFYTKNCQKFEQTLTVIKLRDNHLLTVTFNNYLLGRRGGWT